MSAPVQSELIERPKNLCRFSPCGKYRYNLIHSWWKVGNKFVPTAPAIGERRVMWIGLNPSTADQDQLDNTLRRIRHFTNELGVLSFVMTNLFAYRATLPRDMLLQSDPVGPDNNAVLIDEAAHAEMVIACWGTHGSHLARDIAVQKLIHAPLYCLGVNNDDSPRHPLYVPGTQKPLMYSV